MIHDHYVDGMLKEITKNHVYEEYSGLWKATEDAIRRYWAGKILAVWTLEDFRTIAEDYKERGVVLSDEQLVEIMQEVDENWDAEHGINWEVIQFQIELYIERHGLKGK